MRDLRSLEVWRTSELLRRSTNRDLRFIIAVTFSADAIFSFFLSFFFKGSVKRLFCVDECSLIRIGWQVMDDVIMNVRNEKNE